jgi:SPP1 family predicted phage head-tail adaptor
MRSSELDRLITIQRPVDPDSVSPPLRDELGGVVEQWADVYTDLRAGVRSASAGEVAIAAARHETIDLVFVIRWMPNIDNTMRVLFDGGIYDIASCRREIGRREGLLLDVTKRVHDQRPGD